MFIPILNTDKVKPKKNKCILFFGPTDKLLKGKQNEIITIFNGQILNNPLEDLNNLETLVSDIQLTDEQFTIKYDRIDVPLTFRANENPVKILNKLSNVKLFFLGDEQRNDLLEYRTITTSNGISNWMPLTINSNGPIKITNKGEFFQVRSIAGTSELIKNVNILDSHCLCSYACYGNIMSLVGFSNTVEEKTFGKWPNGFFKNNI